MSCPEAIYDSLYIGQKLQRKLEDYSQYEVQFFAYFSCLLSLYNGNTVTDWHYSFVKTKLGSPYSPDLHSAFETLVGNGSMIRVEGEGDYHQLTEHGSLFLEYMDDNTTVLSDRKQYLSAACNSISLLPFTTVKQAIGNEPVLYSAGTSLSSKSLLVDSNPATKVLYTQFKELRLALEDRYQDLLVPAVVWLESLSSRNIEHTSR
jgi:hypothetical protein